MRVLLARSGSPGSAYYRVDEPARVIAEASLDVDLVVQNGIATTMAPGSTADQPLIADVDVQGADVVVLQLPKTAAMLQILRLLQERGVAVVVEMDDLLTGVPFGHMAHRRLVKDGMGDIALQCAREADLVTVTTPALLEVYARHGRGVIIPNAIPRRVAELPPAYERDPQDVTIGWAGNVLGHPYDLQEMGSGLQQALDRTRPRSRLLVIGQKWDMRQRLGLSSEPAEVSWIKDVDSYLTQVGELFDIGIAPLRLDRFNACKSWLKPLEYSARGVYCVRARSEEYERLGLGVPARAPKDWAKWISVAVDDADRRRETAAAARERVLAGHLVEHTAEQWVAAWRSALEHRARRTAA
jgi:glycosyltransferase involved in cell wall biosynthesis